MSGVKKNAIIILGMHRSGTSALAGCLNQLGVKMGSTLLPADSGNEMGYFEHTDIVLVHDILLSELGCRWDMVGNLPQGWLESEAAQRAKKKLLTIVAREFKGARLWSVKDPRMCRLMPLWFEILVEIETQPKFALMVRHPFAVARSLQKQHGIDLLNGHLLWITHNREALAACQGHEHTLLTYDQLLADPVRSLESMGRALNVSWPRTLRVHYQKILGLVRPELRHEHPSDEGGEQEKFSRFALLYDQLRMQQATMDNVTKALSDAASPGELGAVSGKNLATDSDTNFFPLATVGSETESESPVENSVSEIMSDLLGLIGKYEQMELDRDLSLENRLKFAADQGGYLFAQVFFPQIDSESDYQEEQSRKVLLVPGEWQKVVIELPERVALRKKRLRLDPLGSIGMVAISAVNLVNSASRKTLWSATAENGFDGCDLEGDALLVSKEDALVLASTGQDPRLLLPIVTDLPDVPLRLEIWIKVERDLSGLIEAWQQREATLADQTRQLAKGAAKIAVLEQERYDIQAQGEIKVNELQALMVQRANEARAQAEQLATDRDAARQQAQKLVVEQDKAIKEIQALQGQLTRKEELFSTVKTEMLVHIQKFG